jgi:hypothetical protein
VSVCDQQGVQVEPDDWQAGPLSADDAWAAAGPVLHDYRLAESERVRLMWAVLEVTAPLRMSEAS